MGILLGHSRLRAARVWRFAADPEVWKVGRRLDGARRPPSVSAPGTALGSDSCVALSSATGNGVSEEIVHYKRRWFALKGDALDMLVRLLPQQKPIKDLTIDGEMPDEPTESE